MTKSNRKNSKPKITPRAARPAQSNESSAAHGQPRSARSVVLAVAWLVGVLIAIAVPSYVLFQLDRPDTAERTVGKDLIREISSNFSFGFDRADISDAVTLEQDEAMSLRWTRTSDGALQAMFRLGLYSVRDPKTTARLIAMVPSTARLIDCSYSDAATASGGPGVGYAPQVQTRCMESNSQTARFFSAPLVPNGDADGLFYLSLTFMWDEPLVTNLGIGRDAIHLRYQGRFPLDPSGLFVPADQVNVHFDLSNSGQRSGLQPGVHLEYVPAKTEQVTKASPEPDTTSDDMSIWISNADRPTYLLTVLVDRPGTRRIFDFAAQGVFLIVGAIIGATVPKVRRSRKRSQD